MNFGARFERKLVPLSRHTMISFALLTLGWGIRSFAAPPKHAQPGLSVLVTGASGRTGQILYAYLKADPRIGVVRALVYGSGTGSAAERQKAAAALNCSACDASEGIFYGDVTAPSSLTAAFDGMDTVATYVESMVAQRFRPSWLSPDPRLHLQAIPSLGPHWPAISASVSTYVETTLAQASASWLSEGLSQRQSVPQAVLGSAQAAEGHVGRVFDTARCVSFYQSVCLSACQVAITTAGGFGNDTQTKAVEFLGVENQATALVAGASDVSAKRIVLCSAMGTGVSPFAPQPAHGPPAFLKVRDLLALCSSSSSPSPSPSPGPGPGPSSTTPYSRTSRSGALTLALTLTLALALALTLTRTSCSGS